MLRRILASFFRLARGKGVHRESKAPARDNLEIAPGGSESSAPLAEVFEYPSYRIFMSEWNIVAGCEIEELSTKARLKERDASKGVLGLVSWCYAPEVIDTISSSERIFDRSPLQKIARWDLLKFMRTCAMVIARFTAEVHVNRSRNDFSMVVCEVE